MSSLTTCLKKVGAALAAEDKAAVLARAGALRAEGLSATDAGRQAVDERLAEVAGQIGKVQPLVPEVANLTQTAQALGKFEPKTSPLTAFNRTLKQAGWEVGFIDMDLTQDQPTAKIRLDRDDGRMVIATVDGQGRANVETFQRERSLRMDPSTKGRRPLSPMVEDTFLGRQRYEGARSMLRGLTQYLVDNATGPVTLQDMRQAWAGVMAAPVRSGTDALPAPDAEAMAAKIQPLVPESVDAVDTSAQRAQKAPESEQVGEALPAQPEPASAQVFPVTATGAVQAFNADDAEQAKVIIAKLRTKDALREVGEGTGFRMQIGEGVEAFKKRIGEVADRLTKTAREQGARERVLYDKLMGRAVDYDRAADHAVRAKANGVADDSTAYDGFYKPMGGGETEMVRIPVLLERLAADVRSLKGDPDYAKVAEMVRKARPRIFEAADKFAPEPASAEAPKPAAQTITDLGEKIGGARKDRWAERGLDVSDLDGMSESEGATHVKKSAVWTPDYAALAKASDPVTAAMVKVVYDSLAAKPKADTPQGRRDYVRAMQAVRKIYGEARSVEAVRNAYRQLRAELGVTDGYGQSPEQKAAKAVMFSLYKGRSDPFVFDYTMTQRAKKLVEQGFPGEVAAWTRRFALRERSGDSMTPRGMEIMLAEAQQLGTPMTEAQLRAGFFEVRSLGERPKTVGMAATREEAEALAAARYEATKGKKDDKAEPERPHLDKVLREGLAQRIDRDVTAEDFLAAFGWRGIEFGNWAAQDERQRLLNMAYDSLHDLAEVLGLPTRALSLNGRMGLAFGARGGGRFAAHYEPGRLVINMTKLRGAGSLAHEWAHAVDHYLGELDRADAYQGKARGASGWYSQARYSGKPEPRMVRDADGRWVNIEKMRLDNLRPELAAKIDGVMRKLYEAPVPREQAIDMERTEVKRLEAYLARELDPSLRKTYEEMLAQRRELLTKLEAGGESARTKRSSYAEQAQALSGKATDGYWLRPTEMFARAFESYVFDRLKAMGARSDYLVHGVEEDRYADTTRFKGNPYPAGDERRAINAAFDAFVKELKVKDEGGKTVLYSRRGSSAVNLPPAAIGGSLARVNNHPDYTEAKAGDVESAYRLARDLVTDGFVEEVRQLMGFQGGVLLPVIAQESAGRNKIPLAVAEVLAERLGVETDLEIAQATRTHRTDMDGLSRVLKSPEFYGTVKTGQRYVLVDDTLTQGGTFASLANHIRAGGGEVLGVAALSGKRYSAALSLSDEYLTQLRERFGDVEGAFRAATGYGFDGLTESEGRYLVKHDAPEQVRDRILAAGREAGFREDSAADGEGAGRRLSAESPRERFRRLLGVPSRGIPLAQAQQLARAYETAGLRGVNVAATPADLPADLRRRLEGAADDVRGAYFPDRDQTWVFSDRVNDPDEFAFVVLHEAFHRGLGKTFGRDAKRLMGQMYATNRRLRERADKVAAELGIDRDEAIEEALADMAGEGRAQKLRGWSKLAAMIRGWLGKVMDAVGLRMTFSDAQIETFVSAMAREGLLPDAKVTTGEQVGRMVAASKDADPNSKLLKAIASMDDLFALPKSWSVTPQEIARDIDRGITVQKVTPDPGKAEQYKITTPSGQVATMYVRTPSQYGPTLYGFDMDEGEMVNVFEGRPGENPEDVDPGKQDVYVDASKLTGQGEGRFVYALAGAFAHNTGRIFIGDPAGLSDAALRRRSEQMLSLALKYGTTKHLAPHPRQTVGAPSLGVPPLKWVYGDDIGNMERLIALNVQAVQNAFPDAKNIEFDLESGTFRNVKSGKPLDIRGLAVESRVRAIRSEVGSSLGEATAGRRTLARAAVWRSLLRQRGEAVGAGGARPAGVLDGFLDAGRLSASGQLKGLFSRRASTSLPAQAAAQGVNIQALRNAVMDRFRDAGAKVSWWDKTLGTQYDKARRLPAFGKVFDRVQQYLEDTSTLANEAADQAPSILPKLDSVRDVWDAAKRGLSAKDREAIKAPIFEGTLIWTRQNGELVKVDDLRAKSEQMDPEAKARQLQADGHVTAGELASWNALPLPSYEGAIRNRYEAAYLDSPGVVFTPEELRSRYKLTDAQIEQYQEFRAAVNTSLDQVVATDALRMLGGVAELPEDLHRAAVGDREGFRAALDRIVAARIEAGGSAEDVKRLEQLRADLEAKYAKVDALKARGYAPLMRFGQYAVSVPGQDGGDMDFFALYETKAEANAAARALSELPEFRGRVEQSTMSQEAYKLFAQVPLESLEMFAEAIGAEQSEVFQEYLRMAKNNRSALKRLIQRKGIAGYNEDVSRVLASFVTSNARMAAGTVNLAQAKEVAQGIREGDVKDEAIRLIETVQNPTETAGPLRGLMFVHFIGGSIASAVVNVTQPVMMTTPYLSQWGGMAKASARLLAAARQASSGKIADQELAEALRRAEKDGIVSPQEIHHLTAEAMQTFGRNPVLKRAAFLWGAPFSLAEQFNRRVTFLAAYQTAKAEGMADPFEFAEKAVIETQGLYNKGNASNWARNPIGAVALTFKQYSIHYLEWLRRMWNAGAPGSPERAAGRKAVLFALAMLMLAGGVEGLPFAEDLNDLADTFLQAAGIDTSAKGWKREFFANTLGLGDEGADVVMRGFSAVGGFPMDVSMRMGMGNLLPGTGILLRSNTDVSRDVLELAGPAGSLLGQVKDAGQKALEGDAAGAAKALLPVALRNAKQGWDMMMTGEYRDTKDRKVMDTDEMDAAMKLLGFQPAEVARESSKLGMERKRVQLTRNVESKIADLWAQGLRERDADMVQEARQELLEWNKANPQSRIQITNAQVLKRLKDMQSTRAERFQRAAPKELRQGLAIQ